MVVEYKILLYEKERDLLLDLIEHRIFLLKFDTERNPSEVKEEMTRLVQLGGRLTWLLKDLCLV